MSGKVKLSEILGPRGFPGVRWYAIYHQGRKVGRLNTEVVDRTLLVSTLSVSPGIVSKGFLRSLLSEIESKAGDLGCGSVEVEARTRHTRMYEQEGFYSGDPDSLGHLFQKSDFSTDKEE